MKRVVLFLVLCCSLVSFGVQERDNIVAIATNKSIVPDTNRFTWSYGGIIRGDTAKKNIALVFTADEFGEGGAAVSEALHTENIKASFFLTGRFYRNPSFRLLIKKLKRHGHYLGGHSDMHLLYCDWSKRDSLLVTKQAFEKDINDNYQAMAVHGIKKKDALYFMPPYEWYNDTIAAWTKELGLQLVNFSPSTGSNADYTYPELPNYKSSETIFNQIVSYETKSSSGLNGFILLVHLGTDPRRTDKFYDKLKPLIRQLKGKGYQFQTIKTLLTVPKN